MPSFDKVAALVIAHAATNGPLTDAITLQNDLGVYGDDMHELMAAYATEFKVDMSDYIWYFHTGEEGGSFSIGGFFFPPPYARVREIPITVGMLHQFAELGRWGVEYPPNTPPRHRPDLWINFMVLVGSVGGLVVYLVRGCIQ